MARPQQPELARSAKTDLDPDHIETGLQGQQKPKAEGATGPVPPENEPGHHPPKEQDKPDLDAFAARLGTDPKAPAATSARKAPRPKAESTKTGPAKKTASAKKTAPAKKAAKAGSSKAASRPAAPPKRSAAPTPKEAAQFSAPQPEPDAGREPRLVGLMLLPLRETVKRLEQLDRTLTKRLAGKRRAARGDLGPKDR